VTRYAGVWLGPIVSEARLWEDQAASPAANQWQTGLLEALCDQGKPMEPIAGVPQSAWPRGRLLARTHSTPLCRGAAVARTTGYLNLPIVKWYRQEARIRSLVERQIEAAGPPAVVLSYNAGYPEAATAQWMRSKYGIPWVCVVADAPESSDPRTSFVRRTALRAYGRYQRRWIAAASARVYLSWTLFDQETHGPKLHLDGGIDAVRCAGFRIEPGSPRVLMFTGSLSSYTGIDRLLTAFQLVEQRDCELWISGRGNLEELVIAAAARDHRIRFFGLVDRERLMGLMAQAHVFVNPRPSSVPENRSNFPSKLLEYLSWCRPVISTMTPGIAPIYRSVLTMVEDESPEGLASAIRAALDLPDSEVRHASERIRAFVEKNLLWSNRAALLWDWLEGECGVRAPG
jgi:glycosyltransferase involved in cell wall biosynthesis